MGYYLPSADEVRSLSDVHRVVFAPVAQAATMPH